jgi:uncharacterized protein YgiM (DUF1202 family)
VAYDHETNSHISPRLANRRKHQKALFWVVVTLAVLVAVGAAAAVLGGRSNSGNNGAVAGATTLPGQTTVPGPTTSVLPDLTTTTVKGAKNKKPNAPATTAASSALPPPKPFKVAAATGVNVRQGPGLTYPIAGTIENGNDVSVVCVIDGDSINGPGGPTTKWVRIQFNTLTGYVSAAYVAAGAALNDPAQIGHCPSV